MSASCASSIGENPTGPAAATGSASKGTSARIEVKMNHCFVEPVPFDGERCNVPFDRQFGWGGLQPKRWRGTGVMVRVGENQARFKDDGGLTVVFRPVDAPSVRPVKKALCD